MKAIIYNWTHCPYCVRAMQILERYGITCEEHVMDGRHGELMEIKARYGHPTVPIILLDGRFIGGCNELEQLARAGKLADSPAG